MSSRLVHTQLYMTLIHVENARITLLLFENNHNPKIQKTRYWRRTLVSVSIDRSRTLHLSLKRADLIPLCQGCKIFTTNF